MITGVLQYIKVSISDKKLHFYYNIYDIERLLIQENEEILSWFMFKLIKANWKGMFGIVIVQLARNSLNIKQNDGLVLCLYLTER